LVREKSLGENSYPRLGGTVIPAVLTEFYEGNGSACALPRSLPRSTDAAVRLAMGRSAVSQIARFAYHLPTTLLKVQLPDPEAVLEHFVVDERTRRVLERGRPFDLESPWPVSRYLQIPRFGPRCLLDLLAAREEHRNREMPAAVAAPVIGPCAAPVLPLDAVSVVILRGLPRSEEQIQDALISEGIFTSALSLAQIERAYRQSGRAVPFRVIHWPGTNVAVAASMQSTANAVIVTANQFVSWWGVATVDAVVARVQTRVTTSVTGEFVGRLLAAIHNLKWLDGRREWFSLSGGQNYLSGAIGRFFDVADKVSFAWLRGKVAQGQPRLAALPLAVFKQYLTLVEGYVVDGEWVRRGDLSSPSHSPPTFQAG